MNFEITVSSRKTSEYQIFNSVDELLCSEFAFRDERKLFTVRCSLNGISYVYRCDSPCDALTLVCAFSVSRFGGVL